VHKLNRIPRMIDTHCHLESQDFDLDRNVIVERARSKQIDIISSGINSDTWKKNMDICQKYENVFPALGLSPIEYQNVDGLFEFLKKHQDSLVAIGECGLDYYFERNHSVREKQAISFLALIQIAEEMKLPIQVHSRSAGKAAIALLEKANAKLVHMHAFDAKASIAKMASRELGYYFSIPTSVVRSPQKKKLVKAIDIEKLLVETDSPVLGAERDTRNEPANLPIALREVASILHRDEEEIREIVLENTLRLYSRIKIT
jgi:TatD DNase family protein